MGRTDKEIYRVIDNVNSYYRINSESKKELLLNKYPNAAAAYSLRLLDGYYRGPLVRVRRDDGVEVDVYPDYNNQLSLDSLVTNVPDADDTTTNPDINADATFLKSLQSLGEFVSNPNYVDGGTAIDATVCVWYDQSSTDGVPNDNDAKQVVADNQPLIVSSGVIVTENVLAAVNIDGSAFQRVQMTNTLSGQPATVFSVYKAATNSSFPYNSSTATFTHIGRRSTGEYFLNAGNVIAGGTHPSTQVLNSAVFNGASSTAHWNGTLQLSGNAGTNAEINLIGSYPLFDRMNGTIQEVIIYNSDQSTNRTGIEEDINSFYQIDGYTPPPKLIDLTQALAVQNGGTTADGTPAAAYSLRLLSSTYTGPLVRIRRTIDNTEVDVYPDSDGEFSIYSTIQDGGTELTTNVTGGSTDKTTLHEFLYGQDTDCMVVVWYDQSGNANDATQTTTANQPKIYDSVTGVVTANGKPAVLGTSTGLLLTTSDILGAGDYSVYSAFTGLSSDMIYGYGPASIGIWQTTNTEQRFDDGSKAYAGVTIVNGNDYLSYQNRSGTTWQFGMNGNTAATGTNSANFTVDKIFAGLSGSFNHESTIWEIVFYHSDQFANRTNIEQNINQHYNIY